MGIKVFILNIKSTWNIRELSRYITVKSLWGDPRKSLSMLTEQRTVASTQLPPKVITNETSHDHWLANLEKLVRVIRKIPAPISFYTRDSSFYALRINSVVSNIVTERDSKRHRRLRCILSAGVSLLCYYLCLMADEQ